MGALLSVPVLGFLLMPSLGTYSTSLNLLFFYMTWSTLVLSQPPLKIEVVGTFGVRVLFFLLPSTLFLLFDTLLPSLAVGIKTQEAAALPTRTGGVTGARRGGKRPQWYQVVALSIFNVCLCVGIQAGMELLFTDILHIRSALKVTTTLPMPWSIVKELARSLVLREVLLVISSSPEYLKVADAVQPQVLQYYIHRYIHSTSAPRYIHDLHSSYYHSIRSPYSFATHYDHPVPYLLWRFLPIYLPAIVFRMHLVTYLVLLSFVSLEETLTLSGYSIIPGIMLGGLARRQDIHSQSRGKGNFAPWGIMDWIHGTSIGADVVDDMKDEAQKHQVAERSGRAWNNAKASGKAGVDAIRPRRKSTRKR